MRVFHEVIYVLGTFTSRIWPFLPFAVIWKLQWQMGGGIIVCLMQCFEYIIMLSILFIIIENIFAMPFSPPVRQKTLVKRFFCWFKSRWGCSGCWNHWWKWLSPPTRVSNRWFHHRYVTLARSDNSFSLKPHGKNYRLHMKSEEDKHFIKIVEIDQI